MKNNRREESSFSEEFGAGGGNRDPSFVPDFKLDSSLSQVLRRDSFLGNNNEISISGFSLNKNPENNEKYENDKKAKNLKNLENLENQENHNFKDLLKDLRLSLNLSHLSSVTAPVDSSGQLLAKYAELDQSMDQLLAQKSQISLKKDDSKRRILRLLEGKKSVSVNLGLKDKGVYIRRLEELRKGSKLAEFEMGLGRARVDGNVDGLLEKIKEEVELREKKFDELREFLV